MAVSHAGRNCTPMADPACAHVGKASFAAVRYGRSHSPVLPPTSRKNNATPVRRAGPGHRHQPAAEQMDRGIQSRVIPTRSLAERRRGIRYRGEEVSSSRPALISQRWSGAAEDGELPRRGRQGRGGSSEARRRGVTRSWDPYLSSGGWNLYNNPLTTQIPNRHLRSRPKTAQEPGLPGTVNCPEFAVCIMLFNILFKKDIQQ